MSDPRATVARMESELSLFPLVEPAPVARDVNAFSWSKSRHEKFADCRRAYFYHYYASRAGWEAPPGSETHELFVLKRLSSRWQWAGSVVHEAIRFLLARARAGRGFLELDELLRRTHARARGQWAASRAKEFRLERADGAGLVEHEYGDAVADEEWKRIWDEVIAGSLRAFYASEAFAAIRKIPPERWVTVDDLDSWEFEETKIWVALDFAYRDDAGRLQILDWKTGQSREGDRLQIGVYALFAEARWGVRPDDVDGALVYLGDGKRVAVRADAAALEASKAEMRASIAAMKATLDDPAKNSACVERFPMRDDAAACRSCAFRKPCGRI